MNSLSRGAASVVSSIAAATAASPSASSSLSSSLSSSSASCVLSSKSLSTAGAVVSALAAAAIVRWRGRHRHHSRRDFSSDSASEPLVKSAASVSPAGSGAKVGAGAGAGAGGMGSDSRATAPTASVTIHGKSVKLSAEPGVNVEKAVSCVPFKNWCENMDPELHVSAIHFQSLDMFGPRVGFLKFKTTTEYHGKVVPGIVFMRGGAVGMLVVLTCEGQKYALLCKQPRVPVGRSNFPEIPAGMLDGSGHFAGVAAKEMKEETGIVIEPEEMVDMTGLVYGDSFAGMYPSVGGSDEFLRLFLCEKSVERDELEELQGKLSGCIDEGEVITLQIVPFADLWKSTPDGKTLCALYLYEKLCREGKIRSGRQTVSV